MIQLILYGICGLLLLEGFKCAIRVLGTSAINAKLVKQLTLFLSLLGAMIGIFGAIWLFYQGTWQALEIQRALAPLL